MPCSASALRRISLFCLGILPALLSVAACGPRDGDDDDKRGQIRTISTRADRVSGGDVLVEISGVDRMKSQLEVKLNGHDINADFHPGSRPNSVIGLVTGLELGKNTISAGNETLQITNYPISGPITSGPHIKPFICETHKFQLADGTFYTAQEILNDPACSAPSKITYVYMPIGGKDFIPLPNISSLPADVAMTTTTSDAKVRFIVRVETSTIDRGIYQSAILHDPKVDPEPTPFSSPKGWNRRLIAVEGLGCRGGWYRQGATIGNITTDGMPFVLLQRARLGEGYALFSNTLQNPSNNCNAVLSGESAMMSKEHFIETYGEPRWTVSAGASAGSYGSLQLADAFPGLFDGVLVARTIADPMSIVLSGFDARLLANYFAGTKSTGLTTKQKAAISGYKVSGSDGMQAMLDAAGQSGRADPVTGRETPGIPEYSSGSHSVVPVSERYDPKTNPRGVRGNVYDAARNVYGIDPRTGFALRTFDNVGVQYGLQALYAGAITVTQFLDLNEGIGGLDNDANNVASRSVGDGGAIRRAYQSGLQFVGDGGLASIPVVNLTGLYDEDGGYHYQWFHFALRERMARANGNADNHLSWRGKTDAVPFEPSWNMFVNWVDAVKNDSVPGSAREKTIRNKPANAVDGCWKSPTEFIAEPQALSSNRDTPCNTILPGWTFPRYVAGGPLAADILKCQLKPVDGRDYAVSFTNDELSRLRSIFSDGVCDWTKKGVGQTGVVPWASFGPAPENLLFDVTAR